MVVVRMGKMQDIRYGGMMGRTSVIFQAGGEVRGGSRMIGVSSKYQVSTREEKEIAYLDPEKIIQPSQDRVSSDI
jgi:hypothetical protein